MTPRQKRLCRYGICLTLGCTLGWFGCRYWNSQRQVRAGLRLVTQNIFTTPENTTGLATATSVQVGNEVFDVATILGGDAMDAEMLRLAKAIENLTTDQTLEVLENLMTAVLRLDPSNLKQFITTMVSHRGGPPPSFEPFGRMIENKLSGSEFESRMERLLRRVIAQLPEQALLMSEALPKDERGSFSSSLYSTLALQEPERVIEIMLSPEAGQITGMGKDSRSDAISQAFITLAARDATSAKNRWAQLPDGPLKDAALKGLLKPMTEQDPQAAWTWANSLTGEAKTTAISQTIGGASDTELQRWMTENEGLASQTGSQSAQALKVVSTLAKAHPATAIQWFERAHWSDDISQKDNFYRDFAKSALTDAQKGPDAAAAVLALPAGEKRDKLLGYIARSWAQGDADAAKRWIATLSPADRELLRPRFATSQYANLAAKVGLTEFTPNNTATSHAGNGAASSTKGISPVAVNKLYNADPKTAAEYYQREMASGASANLSPYLPSIIGRLASSDYPAALTFAQQQPTSDLRDRALKSLAEAKPTESSGVISQIQDPIIRQQTERSLAAQRLGLR